MPSNVEKSIDIDDNIATYNRDNLSCVICLQPFESVPKVLSCGHTFCTECVRRVIADTEGEFVNCPYCRTRCIGIKPNFILEDLIQESIRARSPVVADDAGSSAPTASVSSDVPYFDAGVEIDRLRLENSKLQRELYQLRKEENYVVHQYALLRHEYDRKVRDNYNNRRTIDSLRQQKKQETARASEWMVKFGQLCASNAMAAREHQAEFTRLFEEMEACLEYAEMQNREMSRTLESSDNDSMDGTVPQLEMHLQQTPVSDCDVIVTFGEDDCQIDFVTRALEHQELRESQEPRELQNDESSNQEADEI